MVDLLPVDKHIQTYETHRHEYKALNRAATPLSAPASPLLGRERELNDLMLALRNPEKANVILLGDPGSGKTAMVQGYSYSSNAEHCLTLSVDVERLAQDPNADKDAEMANGLLDLVHETTEFSKKYDIIVILFIDEFHRIAMISPSSVEALKPILEKSAHNGFRVIAATTFEEYNDWITTNRALDQRLLRMDIPELPRDAVVNILRSRAEQYDVLQYAEEGIFDEIYDVSCNILISNSQPRASLDILLNMVGNITKTEYMKDGALVREYATPLELNINSKYSLSRPMLNRVIQRSYGIDIDNRVDIKTVRQALKSRILNQDQAVDAFLSRLEMSLSGFNDPTRPKISFLSTGPTGSGKALLDTEPIPTPYGYTSNGDLSIGDVVYGDNGKLTTITGVYPQGLQDVYEVQFVDGRVMRCAGDHLWTYSNHRGHKIWSTNNTKYIKSRLDILKSRYGDNVYFDIPTNKAVLRPNRVYDIEPYDYGRMTDHISDTYKFGSVNQRWELIQGLFDTHGAINDINEIVFTHSSALLIDDVREVLWSLGVTSYLSTSINNQLNVYVENRKKHYFFQQHDSVCRLSYALKLLPDSIDYGCVAIKDIVLLPIKAPMTCIMIDNNTHLYQAGIGHIVTHNTELAKVATEVLGIPLKRFDMSRYMRDEDAMAFADDLANAAWSAPNAYILIDEAEKSTRTCMNILLQVLDDARLTAANNPNRVISFSGNIINLTTNLGSEVYRHRQQFPAFDADGNLAPIDTELIYKALADSDEFETAVLGRIDVILPFEALPRKAIAEIAMDELEYNLNIAETARRKIFVSPDILPYIVIDRTANDSERGGARDAKRNMKNIVIQQLASYMVNSESECPIIIRLDTVPRFRSGLVGDPLAASVMVEECYQPEVVDGWLKQLSQKVKVSLKNEGLFIPVTMHPNEVLKDIIDLFYKGVHSFKSTVDIDKTLIIDSHDDLDVANVLHKITEAELKDQREQANAIAEENRNTAVDA